MCKNLTTVTIKGTFQTMGEENVKKQTPHEIKNNIRGSFYKKLEKLKIAGSRVKFLDFDF
jgi:hypothetical protein